MITYHDKCSDCGYEFEYQKSIKDKFNNFCPECGHESLERVLQSPICFVDEGIHDKTSLQKCAERNTQSMGHYELQEKRLANAERSKIARQIKHNETCAKLGVNPVNLEEKPWYHTKDQPSVDKINSLSERAKTKYIREGKI
jgi:putative FmdB family regulatory protein